MLKITLEFLKLGNAKFLSFIKTMLNQVLATLSFSKELKAKATELQASALEMDSIDTSNTANKAELLRVQRAKITKDISLLISKIEDEVNTMSFTEEEALALMHSLGFKVRKPRQTAQRTLKAKAGNASGKVMLSTRGKADVYDWWYSTDLINFSNPVRLDSTGAGKTEVTGLTRGTYAFFAKAHYKSEAPVVEGPVTYTVL
jgi:hypothetical protein